MIRSIFFDQRGQLSFERQSLANLSLFANAMNIPFGILRVVIGMTMECTAVEVEGTGMVGGAIWFEIIWVVLGGYMHVKTTH